VGIGDDLILLEVPQYPRYNPFASNKKACRSTLSVQVGGVEGNRTPVRRILSGDVYSLDCIGFDLWARHNPVPKARLTRFRRWPPAKGFRLLPCITPHSLIKH
jgi:hypothetical protein